MIEASIIVIPAEAGIQNPSLQRQQTIKNLDSCFHRNDTFLFH